MSLRSDFVLKFCAKFLQAIGFMLSSCKGPVLGSVLARGRFKAVPEKGRFIASRSQ